MTSFFQAFFSLVRLIPCILLIVCSCQTSFDSVYALSVFEFPAKLSETFSSLPDCESVIFCLSRFSSLIDHSLWASCQHSLSLLLDAWTLSLFHQINI